MLAVLHEHQARLDQVEDVFQLGVILAHHRIGRRHRRERRARLHRRHRQQRELDRVRRQDHHRLVRPEAAIEQRLRHRIDLLLGLGVGHLQPVAPRPAALRQPHAVRRLLRPLGEERRHVLFVRLQLVVRLQDDRAVGAPVDGDVAAQEIDRLERGLQDAVQGFLFVSFTSDVGRVAGRPTRKRLASARMLRKLALLVACYVRCEQLAQQAPARPVVDRSGRAAAGRSVALRQRQVAGARRIPDDRPGWDTFTALATPRRLRACSKASIRRRRRAAPARGFLRLVHGREGGRGSRPRGAEARAGAHQGARATRPACRRCSRI